MTTRARLWGALLIAALGSTAWSQGKTPSGVSDTSSQQKAPGSGATTSSPRPSTSDFSNAGKWGLAPDTGGGAAPLRVGLYIPEDLRRRVDPIMALELDSGARLAAASETDCRATFATCRVLLTYPPSDVAGLDYVLVMEFPQVEAKHTGLLGAAFAFSGRLSAFTTSGDRVAQSAASVPEKKVTATYDEIYSNFSELSQKVVHDCMVKLAVDLQSRGVPQIAGPARDRGSVNASGNETANTSLPEVEPATGLFALEADIAFNVLDSIYIDPRTSQISLVGHYDSHYAGPSIPYLQHLATLLEYPAPRFSLEWTAASGPRIDELFRRMENRDELQRLARLWGQVLDSDGRVNKYGRWLLPMLGVAPMPERRPPGMLGVALEAGDSGVKVVQVAAGSSAERAGIRVGDEIDTLGGERAYGGRQYLVVSEFERAVRRAGGGSNINVTLDRDGSTLFLPVTLDPAPGDAWADFDRYDLLEQLLRASGKEDAARIVYSLGVVSRVLNSANSRQKDQILNNTQVAFKVWDLFQALAERGRRGEINAEQFQYSLFHQMVVNMDEAFGFMDHPATTRFEAAAHNGAGADGLGLAGQVIEERAVPMIAETINMLWASHQEYVSVPPDIMEDIAPRGTLEVAPEFIGVNSHSQLARVLYEADYITKRLLNTPSIKNDIPHYLTEFAFEHEHPQFSSTRQISHGHVWISVDKMDAERSTAGNTLAFRNVRMRFNVREQDGMRNLPAQSGGYEDFLTSLYDDFAAQYPVFHELRECAKLTAAANWLRQRNPRLRLPASGRSNWEPPAKTRGAVFLSWTMNPAVGTVNASLLAGGGVSLLLQGLEPFPDGSVRGMFEPETDSSVVDLSKSSMVAPATIPVPTATGDRSAPAATQPVNSAPRLLSAWVRSEVTNDTAIVDLSHSGPGGNSPTAAPVASQRIIASGRADRVSDDDSTVVDLSGARTLIPTLLRGPTITRQAVSLLPAALNEDEPPPLDCDRTLRLYADFRGTDIARSLQQTLYTCAGTARTQYSSVLNSFIKTRREEELLEGDVGALEVLGPIAARRDADARRLEELRSEAALERARSLYMDEEQEAIKRFKQRQALIKQSRQDLLAHGVPGETAVQLTQRILSDKELQATHAESRWRARQGLVSTADADLDVLFDLDEKVKLWKGPGDPGQPLPNPLREEELALVEQMAIWGQREKERALNLDTTDPAYNVIMQYATLNYLKRNIHIDVTAPDRIDLNK